MRRTAPVGLAFLGMATIALNDLRVAGWTISDLLFLAAVAVVVATHVTGRTKHLTPVGRRAGSPVVLVGSLLMLVGGTLSSLGAIHPGESMMVVLRLGWLTFVWFWLFRVITPTKETFNHLLRGFKVTVLVGAGAGVLGYLGLVSLTPANWTDRESGFSGHPNHLAALLATGLPFFILDIPRRGDDDVPRPLPHRLVGCAAVVFGLATTGSMTGLIGAAAGVAALAIGSWARRQTTPRRRAANPLTVIMLIVIVGFGFAYLTTTPTFQRFSLLSEGESNTMNSAQARSQYNSFVIDRIDELLVVGVGHDIASGELAWTGDIVVRDDAFGSRVHNIFFKLMLEAGIPAVVGLVLILATATQQAWRLCRDRLDPQLSQTAVALLGSLVATNVVAQFHPTIAQRYYWLPVGLIGALWVVRRNQARAADGDGNDRRRQAPLVTAAPPPG